MNRYDKIKNFYDLIEFPGRYTLKDLVFDEHQNENGYLSNINNFLDNETKEVLDIGAGTGFITNLFAKKYEESRFTAVDFSTSLGYGENFAKENNIVNTKWIRRNFLEYDTASKFNTIICQGVLHHIPDWEIPLQKMKEMITPGGILLLGLYHPWGKFLQKITPLNYQNNILKHDQCHHPFELTFTQHKITSCLPEMDLIVKYPSRTFKISKSFLCSGGLILYAFRRKK